MPGFSDTFRAWLDAVLHHRGPHDIAEVDDGLVGDALREQIEEWRTDFHPSTDGPVVEQELEETKWGDEQRVFLQPDGTYRYEPWPAP